MPSPILYSFRRCPYAMRARLALQVRIPLLIDHPRQFLVTTISSRN